MEKAEYPKYLYHKEKEPMLVLDSEAHAKLGREWKESPAEFVAVETYREHQAEWPEKPAKKPRAKKETVTE